MHVTNDTILFWLFIVILVGVITLAIVTSFFGHQERKQFRTYIQSKGYVQVQLHGEEFFIRASEVQETTQMVKGYEEATAVE